MRRTSLACALVHKPPLIILCGFTKVSTGLTIGGKAKRIFFPP